MSLASGEAMNGRAAMNGAARMRPAVSVFGRFTRPPSLGQRLQHELAYRLERIEYTIALDGDRLKVRGALDPLAPGELLDKVLTGVIRIWRYVKLGRVLDFPPGIQRFLQLGDRRGVRQIALVVLDHERHLREIVAVLRHVVVQVLHRLQIRLHPAGLRIPHEDDAVDILQNELATGVVVHLARHGIEVEPGLESANRAEVDGQEVEEQRALRLGRERNELSSRFRLYLAVDVLEIRGFSAKPGTVVNDLTVDLARGVVDHRHVKLFLSC